MGDNLKDGIAALEAGRFEEAQEFAEKALRINPRDHAAHNLYGWVASRRGVHSIALLCAQRAHELFPADMVYRYSVGRHEQAMHNWAAAIAHYRACLKQDPGHAGTISQLSYCLWWQEELPEYLELLMQARIHGMEANAAWYSTAASLCGEIGPTHWDRARAYVEETVKRLEPPPIEGEQHHYSPHYSAFKALFWLEDDRAWDYWAVRFKQYGKYLTHECYPEGLAEWNGEPLAGKSILVHGEGGFGDEILFCSVLDDLLGQAQTVHLAVSEELAPLLRHSFPRALVQPISRFKGRDHRDINDLEWFCRLKPQLDYHAHLGNLAVHLRPVAKAFCSQRIPYLSAPPAYREKDLLPVGTGKPRIGLCWKCDPRKTSYEKRRKSIPPQFLRLLDFPVPVDLYALHDRSHGEQPMPFVQSLEVIDLSPKLADFADTAAVLEQLDLVITVDTAVAHLSGALGKKTLLLLSRYHDWRWQHHAVSTWYPSVTLLRQPAVDDWADVMRQVNAYLRREYAAT